MVNGMADIIGGNIGGMATAVETALARLLVPVIDFFMDYASMGDLPEKVAEAIGALQEWVEGILDRVIGWLAEQARAVLASLGLTEDGEESEAGDFDGEIGETVTFSAAGETHRIWIDDRWEKWGTDDFKAPRNPLKKDTRKGRGWPAVWDKMNESERQDFIERRKKSRKQAQAQQADLI